MTTTDYAASVNDHVYQAKAFRASVVVFVVTLLILSSVGVATRVHAGGDSIEPKAGTWKMWVLTSGSQFRLPPPPDKAATAAEIKHLKDLVAKRDAEALNAMADQAAESRIWAGIHFRTDVVTGLALGRRVAQKVIERAQSDGAQGQH
jgi:hypothetical protein